MMFGDMQAIKAGFVRRLRDAQPFVEQRRDRPVRLLDVIE
jgi:hypothetical protein